jgi:hypothetical protein
LEVSDTKWGFIADIAFFCVGELHLNVTGAPAQIEDNISKVMDKSRSQPQGPAGV